MLPDDKAETVEAIVQLERYLIRHPERAKRNGGDNCVELPFLCHLCNENRFDLEMIDGDGYPICIKCIDALAGASEVPLD